MRLRPARRTIRPRLLLGILLGAGCATPRTSTREEASLLPKPGALVALREAGNASGETFDMDAVGMLGEAMQTALREQKLAAAGVGSGASFDLDLEITEPCRYDAEGPGGSDVDARQAVILWYRSGRRLLCT